MSKKRKSGWSSRFAMLAMLALACYGCWVLWREKADPARRAVVSAGGRLERAWSAAERELRP